MYGLTKPSKEVMKEIKRLVRTTWETPYISIDNGSIKRKFQDYEEYFHVDGVGNKGLYHWVGRTFYNAVIDSLAMNLNDLAMKRATPYALVDHLIIQKYDKEAFLEIIGHLVEECKKRNIAIAHGDTAVHENIKGLELSISMLGFIKKSKENRFNVGDVLIGIQSNGLHSNGFKKIIKLFKGEYKKEFTLPTYIYLDTILALDEKINGMMHITGGAFDRLKDEELLENTSIEINKTNLLKPYEIFYEIYNKGVPDIEMYNSFNCGIGFIISVNKKDKDKCLEEISKGFKCDVIGEVTRGDGKVLIESRFSNKLVEF